MKNKKIGVMFCGGCNPKYDRLKKYENLKKENPEYSFEFFDSKHDYDKIIILNGCKSVCMLNENKKHTAVIIHSANEQLLF